MTRPSSQFPIASVIPRRPAAGRFMHAAVWRNNGVHGMSTAPIERVPLEVSGVGPIVNCKGCGTHFAQGHSQDIYCNTCLDWLARCSWLDAAAQVAQDERRLKR